MRLDPQMTEAVEAAASKITRVNMPEPPLPARLSEKQFQAAVVDLAERRGWQVYHTLDSRGSAGGFPDLVLARNNVPPGGRSMIVAELKIGDKQPTGAQYAWLHHFERAGVQTWIWHPTYWEQIQEILR
jgi:hypothetical protein